MGVLRHVRSSPVALLVLLLAHVHGARFLASADAQVLVRDSISFWAALSSDGVQTVLLNSSLVLNTAPPGGTLALKRNVTVQPTAADGSVKAFVDFRDQPMVIAIAPDVTLQLLELELVNMYGLVGPGLNIIRQSPGGRVALKNCVTIRRAGLPTDAAVVNMRSWPRPVGVPGPQQAVVLPNLTYNSTRSSPKHPMVWNRPVALMVDFQTTLPADSSLAFQGLYLGGFTYSAFNSIYFADVLVDPACLASGRPGDECVAAKLQRLNEEAAAEAQRQQGASAPSDSRSLSTTDTIVVAVVVPVGVVLLAALVAAAVLTRRRRARAAGYGKGPPPLSDSSSSAAARPPAGEAPSSSAARSSDIFMGLDEGSMPPVWTQQYEEEAAVEFRAAATQQDATSATAVDGMLSQLINADAARPRAPAAAVVGEAAAQHVAEEGMRPAAALVAAAPLAASPAAAALATSAGAAGGAAHTTAAAAGGGGMGSGGASEGVAVAFKDGQGQPPADQAVVVQPAEAPRPSDVAEELARMAREVRMQVKDVTIRIDTVLGTGAFGVVYGGIWQGIPVAVKTVIISASQERRKRALHEAALCQSIVHPNIIATYACELQPIGAPVASASSGDGATTDSGRTGLASMMPQIVDWRLYIIQELADGGPLSKLYGRPDIWPAPSAPRMVPVVAMALGIARALAHLHSKRIIHGDLTPNNVMLKQDSSEPSGYTIKVGDFGLSVMLPHNQSHLSNLRMGTMFYMCPAVIFKGQVGPSSDVFSLGVILWELFHGRKAGVMTRCGPRYSSIFPAFPPSCPPAYVSVALNCLQKQSANRPNAELVVQHLEGLLQCLKAGQC
ncbi:hypothetical protein CHLRE_02g087850v5 [Chlamydomonas reinhardtii]|uniref:Protein kinase domain-containing protein n=1 Tax=Chlamydomonas reinhardtii TaxID=3055 RepID=A0A2K3E111_CHLRE|nr:uncharacterized protein CHLRE_02g087850v5 [Chlamydomonas reinhardtii]PNW86473.1 hypothetical protein CHLRE_02g087850v5 [Chlamydomonas reinhardtii]